MEQENVTMSSPMNLRRRENHPEIFERYFCLETQNDGVKPRQSVLGEEVDARGDFHVVRDYTYYKTGRWYAENGCIVPVLITLLG